MHSGPLFMAQTLLPMSRQRKYIVWRNIGTFPVTFHSISPYFGVFFNLGLL